MNVGIDIVQIKRLKNHDELARHILSPDEIIVYRQLKSVQRKQQFLAGRWAVKEAIYKCLGKDFKLYYTDLTIKIKDNRLVLVTKSHIEEVVVSISHEVDYAVAVAIRIA